MYEKSLQLIQELWKKELEDVETRVLYDALKEEKQYELKIKSLENEIKSLKQKHKGELLQATRIKWDKTGKYYNLSDFCNVTRDLLFIKENELKQWLYQQEILTVENNKYIPNPNNNISILVDNELYIKYEFIRETIMGLRTLVFLGDKHSIDTFVKNYKDNKQYVIEQMANTVYVECKQRSVEFQECKDNKFFIEKQDNKKLE